MDRKYAAERSSLIEYLARWLRLTLFTTAFCFCSAYSWKVTVHTANTWFAGTDANVSLTIFGKNPEGTSIQSDAVPLDTKGAGFKAGDVSTFTINTINVGNLYQIRMSHDETGRFAGWNLERVGWIHCLWVWLRTRMFTHLKVETNYSNAFEKWLLAGLREIKCPWQCEFSETPTLGSTMYVREGLDCAFAGYCRLSGAVVDRRFHSMRSAKKYAIKLGSAMIILIIVNHLIVW